MIGKQGDNAFTPASKLTQEGSIDKNNPVFGLKRDIIRLIGNLVYKNRTNQDKVCFFSKWILSLVSNWLTNEFSVTTVISNSILSFIPLFSNIILKRQVELNFQQTSFE